MHLLLHQSSTDLKEGDLYMQLIEPAAVRKLLEDKKQWLTIHAIANGLSLNRNTVNKSLSGQRVTAFTARTIAKAAGVDVTEIARLVEN